MQQRMGITFRITLAFLLLVGMLSAGTSLAAYLNGRQALQTAVQSELLSTAIEKEAALEAWAAEAETHVASLAASTDLQDTLAALALALSTKDSAGRQASHDHLVASLHVWVGPDHPFQDLLILGTQTGEVWAATTSSDEGKFMEDWLFFSEGQRGAFVQNPLYSVSAQRPVMFASAPIQGQDGRAVGVLAGQLNLDGLNAIIQRSSGVHQTMDAFLVNPSNLLVTQPRFVSDPAVLQRGIHTQAVNQCLQKNSGQFIGQDYRGVPAIYAYRWLAARNLCLIVKMDQAEALAPAQAFGQAILLVSALALLFTSVLAVALARSITRPILALQAGAVRFGQGDLETKVEVNTADELGQLAQAFNRMAANLTAKAHENAQLLEALRRSHSELEGRVVERTAELAHTNQTLREEIAERQRAEAALRLKDYALESTLNAIAISDLAGSLTYVNPAFLKTWGYADKEQVLGKAAVDFWQVGAKAAEVMQMLHDNGGWFGELVARNQMGIPFDVQVSANLVTDQTGQPTGMMASFVDITDLKRAEAALTRQREDLARSNAELEQFAYVASHDLQEPLRMVSSYVKLLAQRYQGQLDPKADKYVAYAVEGASRMQTLINDLLTYSRVGTRGKPFAPVACEQALSQALANLEVAIQETGAVITHEPLPILPGDEVQLVQLFQNLVGNALKFRRPEQPPRVQITARRQANEWLLAIQDNGIGIAPEHLDRIFIIFQRLHTREEYPGTGIGLAICKKITQRHRGRIWVESEPGHGSTFYLALPVEGDN